MTNHEWDPNAAWEALQHDRTPDAASAYGDIASRCPVARVTNVLGGFWAVLRNATLSKAALDTDTFSNVVPLFQTRRPPLECDPPEHQLYRRVLNPYFSVERMLALEPDVRRYAVESLDPLIAAGTVDFAGSFTYSFPTRVLCRLLAIPDEDWRLINEWGGRVDRLGGQSPPGSAERMAAGEEIRPYLLATIQAKREAPGDDIISGLVGGGRELPSLDNHAVLGIVMMLISAGHTTTANAIGNLVLRLARDPYLQQRLRADPSAIPAAVEESVRIDAPQQAMRRVATRDTELDGTPIAKGDWVWLVFGAANLDEDAVPRAAHFELGRSPNRHVGFGRGIHLCVGAPLARMEVRVAIEELLARTTSFEVVAPIRRPAWPRLGVTALPLRLVG